MIKDDCIFCKIGAGEIPVQPVYEDEYCIAFPDMEPLMPVHVLIIPKDHYSDVADDVPQELLGHLFKVVQKDGQRVAEGTNIEVAPYNTGKEFIVLSGLKVGDEIIADGAGMVKEGALVK